MNQSKFRRENRRDNLSPQMVRTDVSYFQDKSYMPHITIAHYDGYNVIHMDDGIAMFVTDEQMVYMADVFNAAAQDAIQRRRQEHDHATL